MRSSKKRIIIRIVVAAGIIAVCTGLFFGIKGVKDYLEKDTAATVSKNATYEEDLSKHPYIKDVNYTGPVKYMELFDYPFEKSEMYKKNKEFDPELTHTELVSQTAKEFIETLYTTDYREIVSDTSSVKNKIGQYVDDNMLFYSETAPVANNEDGLDYFLEDMSDYYVENALSTKANFITDPELVYEDGYLFCRGVIELEGYGDNGWKGLRCIPAEVMMKQDIEDMKFVATGIIGINGYEEFLVDE